MPKSSLYSIGKAVDNRLVNYGRGIKFKALKINSMAE
jgi:hypothetical protein